MDIVWMMTCTGKFEFIYKEGKPFLKVLDTSIKRVAQAAPAARPSYMHDSRPAAGAGSGNYGDCHQKNLGSFLILMQILILILHWMPYREMQMKTIKSCWAKQKSLILPICKYRTFQ